MPAALAIGMRKGVILLNGRNLGRYWDIGPQRYYYMPAAYLAGENTLVILEEGGARPANVALVYDGLGLAVPLSSGPTRRGGSWKPPLSSRAYIREVNWRFLPITVGSVFRPCP